MSMHDVDKSGQNRLNPTPNSSDFLAPEVRMAHGTTGFTLIDEATGDVAKLTIKDGVLLLIKDGTTFIDASDGNIQTFDTDGSNPVVMGKKPDGRGGFVVAKQGSNVEDIY